MLEKKTVFILGAGASKPYNFPTAIELSKEVISNFDSLIISICEERANRTILSTKEDYLLKKIKEYNRKFGEFKDTNNKDNNNISIDEYISRENREYMRPYALKLMSHYLMQREEKSKRLNKSDWIELLVNKASYGVDSLVKSGTSEIDKNLSNIRIITFNYERSFEHFLLESLKNKTFEENNVKRFMCLFTKNIIHIYGSFGKILNSVSENNIETGFCEYGYSANSDELDEIIKNIKLIYDERKEYDIIIKDFLKDAEQIFFLGFGYDEFNIKNLCLSSVENPDVKIYGTAKGKAKFLDRIKKLILDQNSKFQRDNIEIKDIDCKTMLEHICNNNFI
jgi:hypothetical protein